MILIKEDIQFIDNYLKNSGITLVDVRLEMVDHIASEIEVKIENGEEETFYDAFKAYMVKGKKTLLNEYEKTRAKSINKVLMKTLKTFLEKDVMLIGLLCCWLVFQFKGVFLNYFEYSLVLLVPAFVLYFVLFKGFRKTSIASGLVLVLIIPLYLGMYFKNPFTFIYVLGVYVISQLLRSKYNIQIQTKKHKVFSVLIYLLMFFPLMFFMIKSKDSFNSPNEAVVLIYYAFQLTHWYVVFKQIFRSKKELDNKYKLLLG